MNRKHILFFIVFIFLLIQSTYGQERYYTRKDFTIHDGLPTLMLYHTTQDHNGNLWIASDYGLTRYNGKNFKTFTLKDGLVDQEIHGVFAFLDYLVCASHYGYAIYKTNQNTIQLVRKLPLIHRQTNFIGIIDHQFYIISNSNHFQIDSNGNLKLNEANHSMDKIQKAIKTIIKQDTACQMLLHKSEKGVYFTVYGVNFVKKIMLEESGGIKFISNYSLKDPLNPNHKLSIEYPTLSQNPLLKDLVKDASINNLEEDREQNVWVTTKKNGLILMIPNKNIVSSIENTKLSRFSNNLSNDLLIQNESDKTTLDVKNHALSIYSNNKQLYTVSSNKKYPLQIGINTIKYKNQELFINLIKDYHMIDDSTLLVATIVGGYHIKLGQGIIQKKLSDDRTTCIYAINKDDIYLGTYKGLYHYNTTRGLERIIIKKHPEYKVNSIALDRQNNLWIGTNGLGIFELSQNLKNLKQWTTDDGLLSNSPKKINIDSKNQIWISYNNGLQKLDKEKNSLRTIQNDGLLSNTILDFKVINDQIHIVSDKGYSLYQFQNDQTSFEIPLNIEPIKINGQHYDTMPRSLNATQNKLTFAYNGIYFADLGNIVYRYRLIINEQQGTKWQTTNEKQLMFENLSHASYRLEIQAIHKFNTNISSPIKKITFTIKPFFYQTIVFWMLFFVFLSVMSIAIISFYLKRKKTIEIEKSNTIALINKSTLKSLQSQMNPHFVFNSLGTIQNLILKNEETKALNYVSDFSLLMRKMLNHSRMELISVEEEIDFLKNYIELEQVRFKESFTATWDIQLTPDEMTDIYIPTMFIQPLIENAIKHGLSNLTSRKGELMIRVSIIDATFIQFVVKDNGENLQIKTSQHKSTAINLIKERLELYKKNNLMGSVELHIGPHGAEAIILLPI